LTLGEARWRSGRPHGAVRGYRGRASLEGLRASLPPPCAGVGRGGVGGGRAPTPGNMNHYNNMGALTSRPQLSPSRYRFDYLPRRPGTFLSRFFHQVPGKTAEPRPRPPPRPRRLPIPTPAEPPLSPLSPLSPILRRWSDVGRGPPAPMAVRTGAVSATRPRRRGDAACAWASPVPGGVFSHTSMARSATMCADCDRDGGSSSNTRPRKARAAKMCLHAIRYVRKSAHVHGSAAPVDRSM
jgi:hypothetical protein